MDDPNTGRLGGSPGFRGDRCALRTADESGPGLHGTRGFLQMVGPWLRQPGHSCGHGPAVSNAGEVSNCGLSDFVGGNRHRHFLDWTGLEGNPEWSIPLRSFSTLSGLASR